MSSSPDSLSASPAAMQSMSLDPARSILHFGRNDKMPNLACVSRAQSRIDQKLTLKPAEAGASSEPSMNALLTSKCVKFIGWEVDWGFALVLVWR